MFVTGPTGIAEARVESVRPTESYVRGSICDPMSRISSLKICLLLSRWLATGPLELLTIQSQRITRSIPSYVFTQQNCLVLVKDQNFTNLTAKTR
jgi:hypothetical protein